jgi:hypothetical protein
VAPHASRPKEQVESLGAHSGGGSFFPASHHVVPFAEGGDTVAANMQLRCRAHNAYEAEQWFGALVAVERQGSDDATIPGATER